MPDAILRPHVPGGSSAPVGSAGSAESAEPDAHVVKTYVRAPEVFVSGSGATLRTATGATFLDMLGGIAVSALGHGHPELSAALADQAGKLLHVSNLYRHPLTEVVAGRLARLTGLEAVFFSNSGAEANECALKAARAFHERNGAPERNAFIALEGGFHGRTLGALSVSSGARYREPFEPLIPGVHFAPANDLARATELVEQHAPAAVILEPIQGEGGLRPLCLEFLRGVRALTERTGTLLIHDEIQCGSGRTGPFLAGDAAGIKPDIVTLAKPLAAGVPMGATVIAERFANSLVPGDHGSTFGGGPLACRAAEVFLSLYEAGDLADRVRERGAQLKAGLEALRQRHSTKVLARRGRGLMQGIKLAETGGAAALAALAHARGLLACPAGDEVLRFLPPYVVSESEIDQALTLLDSALSELPEPN